MPDRSRLPTVTPRSVTPRRSIIGIAAASWALATIRIVVVAAVAVGNLERSGTGVQLTLPVDGGGSALDAALDELRHRFGPAVVTRATLLDHRAGLVPWLFPGDAPAEPPLGSAGT